MNKTQTHDDWRAISETGQNFVFFELSTGWNSLPKDECQGYHPAWNKLIPELNLFRSPCLRLPGVRQGRRHILKSLPAAGRLMQAAKRDLFSAVLGGTD